MRNKKNIVYGIYLILFILFWISIIYNEDKHPLNSIYWLLYKITGWFSFFLLAIILYLYVTKYSKWFVLLYIFLFGFNFYSIFKHELKDYNATNCNARFGVEFNKYRHRMGVPELPSDWEGDLKREGSVLWKSKNKTIGHTEKYIRIDSTCNLLYEDDEYQLKSTNKKERSLNIRRTYQFNKSIDSIVYSYSLGDSTIHLNNKQADSLFTAEKIKKDY